MDLSPTLAAELRALSEALDRPDEDLSATVRSLSLELRQSIPSYAGLAIEVSGSVDPTFTLAVVDQQADGNSFGSSLTVPLAPSDERGWAAEITFFATRAGAFDEFAAQIAWILDVPPQTLVLDASLSPVRSGSTLEDLRQVNLAVGMMLGDGYLPDEAREELRRKAYAAGVSLVQAAADVIESHMGPDSERA